MVQRTGWLLAFCFLASTAWGGLIGGSPSQEMTAVLTGPGGALVDVYSAVFDGPKSLPVDSGLSLGTSEKLYAYVLYNRAESPAPVTLFGLAVSPGGRVADLGAYDSETGIFQGTDEIAPTADELTPKGLDFSFAGDELGLATYSEVMFFVSDAPADLTFAQVRFADGSGGWGTVLAPSGVNLALDVSPTIPEPPWMFLPGLLFAAAARRRVKRAA